MDFVMLFVGRLMPRSVTVTGGTLIRLSLMCTNPNRKSLTSAGEKRCVSFTLKNRQRTGLSYGKFRSVALILLANVPPRDACNPPAPHGISDSDAEKIHRA